MSDNYFATLNEGALRAILRRAGFGAAIRHVQFPDQGVNNQTYLLDLEDGASLVVKVRPVAAPGADKEPAAPNNLYWPHYTRALLGPYPNGNMTTLPNVAALLKTHGTLRVPEIYLVDTSCELVPAPYLVAERLSGQGHAFVYNPLTPTATRQLGEHLASVHRATAPGSRAAGWGIFGRRGDFASQDWWPRFADAYGVMVEDLARRSETMRLLEKPLYAALDRAAASGTPDAFPLICIDQAPTHYLRADDDESGAITAMVDVEGHLWAPREYELAMAELWLGDHRGELWAGYEPRLARPAAQDAVRDAYQWMTWMEWIYCDYTLQNNPVQAAVMENLLADKCREAAQAGRR